MSRVRKNYDGGKLTGFDKAILKRQLYHMMFLEEKESSAFDTISYNDSEYLDDYESFNGFFVRFINSGLPTLANMSFSELIRLPNHLADWCVDWATKQSLRNTADNNKAMEELERGLVTAAKVNTSKKDPFSSPY